MGLDLKLLVVDGVSNGLPVYAHTMIEMQRDSDLFAHIDNAGLRSITLQPESQPFNSFVSHLDNGEQGYGKVTDTAYWEPVAFVRSNDLAETMACFAKRHNFPSPWNDAAADFLAAIQPTWVGLWWH